MTTPVAAEPVNGDPGPEGHDGDGPSPRSKRRLRKVLIGVGVVVVLLVAAGAVWFISREDARPLGADEALDSFRAGGGTGTRDGGEPADGLPAAGVYQATATGTESIGIPGFDESFGPRSPVTVTHEAPAGSGTGDASCFTYRVDFNSHHWRTWTFCPTDTATFALTRMEGWTARKAPALNIETLVTYDCDQPVDFLWQDAAVGDTRQGDCTGTTDLDDSVTGDAITTEVLGTDTLTIGGKQVDVVRVRSTERFSRDQTGIETDEWWLDAETGLPVRLTIDSSLSGGASDYAETGELELSTLTPAT